VPTFRLLTDDKRTHPSTSGMVWSGPIPDGVNEDASVVRLLLPALGLTVFLFQSLPVPLGGSFIGHAAAQSRDELYAKCRRAVFRRYGQPGVQYNRAPGRRVLPSKFAIGAIDQCVASGGRAI
jgi:hypothetical protein